jgi:transcriptional regulator with XRE-family HTH domain
MDNIGARIKAARNDIGFSREQVGRKLGVSQQQIARYESGENNISAERLLKLADILHEPIDYFYELYSE